MTKRRTKILAALFAATAMPALAPSAAAQGLAETLEVETPVWNLGNYELRLEGYAQEALYSASQDSGDHDTNLTGLGVASLRVQRLYDSGLITGVRATALLARGDLSGDSNGNDTVQKLYAYVQTGLGRVEIGTQDGAAYTLGLTGPQVDPRISLENPYISLFRNPVTGERFNSFSKEVTAVQTSSNYAKISYISPRLIGLQIGASYTPNLVKSVLPFTGNPSNKANTQASVWEIAANYTHRLGDVTMGVSAAYGRGALRNPTPGRGDITDLAFGLEFQAELFEFDVSWGGGYRVSSGYGFSSSSVYHDSLTERLHLSAMAERNDWTFGGEYSHTYVDAPVGTPRYIIDGYQAALGYQFNRNLQITAGWQFQDYDRNLGAFYNGEDEIRMDAGFLSLGFTL